jgi:glycosyltransferase involved in cell wall biosynthesis
MGTIKNLLQHILKLVSARNLILGVIRRKLLLYLLAFVRIVPFTKIIVRYLTKAFPWVNSYLLGFASAHPQQKGVARLSQNLALPAVQLKPNIFQESGSFSLRALPKGQRIIYYYVDHTVGCPVNTGMQRVVRGLARSLLESGEQLYFVKWDFDQGQLLLINREELEYLSKWIGPELSPKEVTRYPTKEGPNVLITQHIQSEANWLILPEVTHINYHPAPVTLDVIMAAKRLRLKSAFIFYDATPLRREELVNIAARHAEYMQHLLLADLILPISEWSASDLASYLAYAELASSTTTPPIISISLPGEMQHSPRKTISSSIEEKLILSIGSITTHKNQLALAYAFEKLTCRLPDSGWRLVLVGNIHPDLVTELATITNSTSSIKVIYNLTDDELNKLLEQCAFTVFPSVLEGFGLPILESIWHGKPCICANFGAMSEVAKGGGCLMVDVRSVDTILSAIETMIFDTDTFSRLQDEALSRSLTQWNDYANKISESLNYVSNPLNKIGIVYYWVENTCSHHKNLGISQTVRSLANALIDAGVQLVPTTWNKATQNFMFPTHEELVNLSQSGGPAIEAWADWQEPAQSSISDWLIIPEPLTGDKLRTDSIKRYTSNFEMRIAGIFYDSELSTNKDIDLEHKEYMRQLNQFELIFPISELGRNSLIRFLQGISDRTPNLEKRVRYCAFPDEVVLTFNRQSATKEIASSSSRSWQDYVRDIIILMSNERQMPMIQNPLTILPVSTFNKEFINISPRPLLSICISTYNRAGWLAVNLANLNRLMPSFQKEVEIIVCDNTSTDNTPEIIKPYLWRKDFKYYRNPRNVGMLGNLKVTAHHARGRHVWILGDDDLLKPGSIEHVLKVLRGQPDVAMVYLNYAFTREDDATKVKDLGDFLNESTPVTTPSPDISGPVWRICTESENFFTAIYCLVLRRDHALQAYSQNTEGRPFSTMLTCIPTTYHVLNHMMNEDAYWIGEPMLVVNLNVSWMKYASIWILERLPEVFDMAEQMGADKTALDNIRSEHLRHVHRWFNEIYLNDTESNIEYFNPIRLFTRFKHLKAFDKALPGFKAIYEEAHYRHAMGAELPTMSIFSVFNK